MYCGEEEEGRKMNVDIYDKKQCGDGQRRARYLRSLPLKLVIMKEKHVYVR